MLKKIFMGAGILGISSLASRLLGVVRANQLASIFGTSASLNAYYAGFALPDFLYSVLVYAAVASAFVPLFLELKGSEKWRFTSAVLDGVVLATTVFAVVVFVFAPQLVGLIYSGFDLSTQSLTVEIVRILCLSPILFGISSVFMSLQTAVGRFTAYSLAPVIYNLAIIFGVVYFRDIYMVAWCTVIGAGLHMLLNLVAGLRLGFRYKLTFWRERDHLMRFWRLGAPRVVSMMGYQINLLVDSAVASLVTFGSLSVLRYAQDINSFPLGIFGLSIATASFGSLTALFAKGNTPEFLYKIKMTLAKMWFFIVPSAVGLILVREDVTAVLLQYGNFDAGDTYAVSGTLAYLAVGLFASATVPLLNRIFYAMKNTRVPLYASLAQMVLNIVLDLLLYQSWGVWGLALASSVAVTVQMLYLFLRATDRFQLSAFFPRSETIEIVVSSALMGLVVFGVAGYLPNNVYLHLALSALIGAVVYGVLVLGFGTWRVLKK